MGNCLVGGSWSCPGDVCVCVPIGWGRWMEQDAVIEMLGGCGVGKQGGRMG